MTANAREFSESARRYTADLRHRDLIQRAMDGYYAKRDENKNRFQSWAGARNAAAEIKWQAVNHLDRYLEEFASKLEARGVKIFWAADAHAARDYVVQLARRNNVRSIVKSKSMTTEEIHLNDALEKEGFGVVESDLGEYIVQLRGEAPYHLVFPAMHLRREQISDLFRDKLGATPTDKPEELTMIARRVMRQKFCAADMGITSANFCVAETGMISITENEGNARLTAALPKIHVAVIGMEKILPKLSDLALFLPMLATAGAGQSLTCYNTLYSAARLPGEPDGPREFHIVLLDNRRSQLLADAEQRDALHCIRCGACLNVCPIFKNVGGHSYGTVYQGPIGSVITPHLRGLQDWKHLSQASSLCGACTETCPVKINLHHHLLHNRRNAARAQGSLSEKIMYRGFAFTMTRPAIYRLATRLARLMQPLRRLVNGTFLDPLQSWTKTRGFPSMSPKSFRDLWSERQGRDGAPPSVPGKQIPSSQRGPADGNSPSPEGEGRGEGELNSDSSLVTHHSSLPKDSRDLVLGRIREALKIAAPHPVAHTSEDAAPYSNSHGAQSIASPSPGGEGRGEGELNSNSSLITHHSSLPEGSLQQWLPPVGKTVEEQIELFRQNAQSLRADFHVCADLNAAIQLVKDLAATEGWKKIGFHNGELTSAVARGIDLPQVKTDKGYDLNDLESCDVGLTECEALIAQTGSVLVSASGSGGRALSVLPPHHVVLARRSQMLPDLTAALQRAREKYGDTFPSILSFITGPSRTGDIERILVLGAHGPKKLTILLL